MTGTLPGLDFGGTYQQPGDGPSHGHLPGLDFGGQNPTDPPNLDLAPGPDHLGTFDHAADMGPPPAIA
jgi:hypothetical protein